MAKGVRATSKLVLFLFRIIGFVLILAVLTPLLKVYRAFVKQNGSDRHFQEARRGPDSAFAPIVEKLFGPRARADIPPH